MGYKYGAYGNITESVAKSSAQSDTVAVYVGTAPVNLVRGYDTAGVVNNPVKVIDYLDAQKKLGLSKDWAKFTLCEAIEGHFNNQDGNVGPVYFINVLDPTTHRKATATEKALTFSAGGIKFLSDTIILDTFKIKNPDYSASDSDSEDEYLTEGTDYTVDYDFNKGAVIVSGSGLTGEYTAEFYEIETANIDEDDVIGGATAGGVYTGLGCVKQVYQKENRVVNLIAAPGWSHIPAVYNAMLTAGTKINGHWEAFIVADIPTADETGGAETITAAKTWKTTNAYNNERSAICWPKAKDNVGRVWHLSTLRMVEYMRTDATHNGVPFETAGNKEIGFIVSQFFGESATNKGFDNEAASDLTSVGINTVSFWGGSWNQWGDHTAAYAYGVENDPRAIFDCTIRMLFHCVNGFQVRNGVKIDKPMTLRLKNQIMDSEQEILDGYKNDGAFIGEPQILFLESDNNTADMMNGDFQFRMPVTTTPPLHSATVNIYYTDDGFASYFSAE